MINSIAIPIKKKTGAKKCFGHFVINLKEDDNGLSLYPSAALNKTTCFSR